MKQFRHNEAQMGENGIIFLGLCVYHNTKLNYFAPCLRYGSIEFPFNDINI